MALFSRTPSRPRSSRPQDSFVDRLSTDPYLDWVLIVSISAFIAVLSLGVGSLMYFNVKDRLSTPVSGAGANSSSLFDEKALADVLDRISARAAERTSIRQGTVAVPADPAL